MKSLNDKKMLKNAKEYIYGYCFILARNIILQLSLENIFLEKDRRFP